MTRTTPSELDMLPTLRGSPSVDLNRHVMLALRAGRSASAIAWEAVRLMRGPGKLSGSEYFYYRLWDGDIGLEQKRAFVGRKAQNLMHIACNDSHWYQTAADKILFQTISKGAGLPVPETLAITQHQRWLAQAETVSEPKQLASWLRRKAIFPLFAKPAGGKYSLNVLSIEGFDPSTDCLSLLGGGTISVEQVVRQMLGGNGYILQKRMAPHPDLAKQFGPRLWSVRALVLVRPEGPMIHRALVKIATGTNPADNYWRAGNMVGALDTESGRIIRAVRGAGADLAMCQSHPDTSAGLVGALVPNWRELQDLVFRAARVFPGIRTQSWDVALTDQGHTLLEVNYGGDLNLAQLAESRGVLDEAYREHLASCGYQL